MQFFGALIALLFVAFLVSIAVSFLVSVVAGALSLLPVVFVILLIWFFVRGGKIRIEFPDRSDRDRLD